jgi:hypothetical protein
MQSTKFSKSSKEGRGDTSVWTDTPLDRAQKAKMKYVSLSGFENALSGQLSLSLSVSPVYFKEFCNSFILP